MFQDGACNPGRPPSPKVREESTLSGCIRLLPPDFRRFSHPFRGSFQLSLTVLLRYRSWDIFSLGSRWLPNSRTISEVRYSGTDPSLDRLRLRGCHPLCRTIPGRLDFTFGGTMDQPITPHPGTVSRVDSVWTSPLSLAVTKGIPVGFFSSLYLDASVREVPPPTCVHAGVQPTNESKAAGNPIRASPDQSLPAATRGLSQLATPFFGAQAKSSIGRRIFAGETPPI